MTAHVVYPAWDAERCASLSPIVIGEVIRGRIGFDGLLMSDDLGMQALSGDFGDARGGRARGGLRHRAALLGRHGRDGARCAGAVGEIGDRGARPARPGDGDDRRRGCDADAASPTLVAKRDALLALLSP